MKNLISYLIIQSIKSNWDNIALYENGEKHSFKKLALFIIKLSTFLDKVKITSQDTIAICSKFSFNWLVVYLTCLIKGIPVLLVHPKESARKVKWQLQRNEVKLLFYDSSYKNISSLVTPLLRARISLTDFKNYVLYHEFRINSTYEDWLTAMEDFHNTTINENWSYTGENFEKLQGNNYEKENIAIMQYTPGTSEPSHLLAFSFEKIGHIISNISSTILREKVAYFADYFYFHFIVILNKIINGETIHIEKEIWSDTVRRNNFEKIGVESYLFKIMWEEYFSFLKEKYFRLLQRWGKFFVNLIVKRKLYKVLGSQLKEIIILNNELPLDILKTLNDAKIKLSSTYGTLETGQLLSFNDSNTCKSVITAGKPSYLYSIKIDSNNPTEIPGEILYKNNYKEPNSFWIPTGDIGKINNNGEIVIYGKKVNMIIGNLKIPIFPEYIERRIEIYPYIKKVCIVDWNKEICCIVEVDTKKLDSEKYTYVRLQKLLDYYRDIINSYYGSINQITFIAPVSMNILPVSTNNKLIRVNFLKEDFSENVQKLKPKLEYIT